MSLAPDNSIIEPPPPQAPQEVASMQAPQEVPSMQAPPEAGAARGFSRWAIPLVVIVAVWVWLVFSSGGYPQSQWLLQGIVLAATAFVLFALGAFPRLPSRTSLAVLGLFLGYFVWVAISASWALSVNAAWDEAGRTGLYLVVFALALTMLGDRRTHAWLRYALAVGTLVVVGVVVWRFGASTELEPFFWIKRFIYPVGYPNNNAALFLVLFWPLLWMAADPREHWFVRGPVLGLCAALLMLAIPTQSRGGFWAFAVTIPLMLLLSTARLRTLVHLALPLGVTAAAFPALNSYWSSGAGEVGSLPLVRWVLLGMAIVAAGGVVMALVDRRLRLGPRVRLALGTVVLVAVVALAFAGLAAFERNIGSPRAWIATQWHYLHSDQTAQPDTETAAGESSARFLALTANGRLELWRIGWDDFRSRPLTGIGAGSFPFSQARNRSTTSYVRTAHSIVFQTLGDTGVVGTTLFFGTILLGAGLVLRRRLQSGWARLRRLGERLTHRGPPHDRTATAPDYSSAWTMALLVAICYWIAHGAVDWLWHMPAVTIPVLLFTALAITEAQRQAPRRPQTRLESQTLPQMQTPPPPARAAGRTFRWAAAAVSVLIVVGLLLPYLAERYLDAALANTTHDPALSVAQTRVAARLNPASPDPFTVQSRTYRAAAQAAAAAPAGEDVSAVAPGAVAAQLDNLALALWAADRACRREPQGWVVHYQAAQAALELATTRRNVAGAAPSDVGLDPSSLAVDTETVAAAGHYRAMTVAELRDLATGYAQREQHLNPLERRITVLLEEITAPADSADIGT